MKKIAFHTNELNIRGTNVAIYDYAHYNETILGNKSYILSNKNANLEALPKFKNRFDVFLYEDFLECNDFVKKEDITHVYYIKAGSNDGRVLPGVQNLVHSVFQHYEPHGERYVYIAEWLSKKMCGNSNNYVPHIIQLPEPTECLRSKLNIPPDSVVLGRHGGYDEFNYTFAQQAVIDAVTERDNLYFLFVNTRPFCKHDRVFFIKGTYDLQNKSNFINTCDAMIHARQQGEIFSLSIGEFLFFDKPVITCKYGNDEGHHYMLKDKGLWYTNYQECKNHLLGIQQNKTPGIFKHLVEDYTPEKVMDQFNKKFLSV